MKCVTMTPVFGGFLFCLLLLFLWMPLFVFSSGNPTYQVPSIRSVEVNMSLAIKDKLSDPVGVHVVYPLFEGGNSFTVQQLSNSSVARAWQNYESNQFQLVCVAPDSQNEWRIAPPFKKQLVQSLQANASVDLLTTWTFLRSAPAPSSRGGPQCVSSRGMQLTSDSQQKLLTALVNQTTTPVDLEFKVLKNSKQNTTNILYNLFWILGGDSCSVSWEDARQECPDIGLKCSLQLQNEDSEKWWKVSCQNQYEANGGCSNIAEYLDNYAKCGENFRGPSVVTVLEKVQTGFIGQALSKFGVVGLYVTFVLAVGRLFRNLIINIRMKIPVYEFPYVQKLIMICQDLYIARAEGQLTLEEELYYSLLNIYRQPDLLFELTKKKLH